MLVFGRGISPCCAYCYNLRKSGLKIWKYGNLFLYLQTKTIILRPNTTFPCHIHDALDINRL